MILDKTIAGLCLCAAAHGISQIVVLNFINMRLPDNVWRSASISIYHFFYLVGIATTAILYSTNVFYKNIGHIICGLGAITFIRMASVELIYLFSDQCERESYSMKVNFMNETQTIFHKREQLSEEFERKHCMAHGSTIVRPNKQLHYVIAGLLMKLQTGLTLSVLMLDTSYMLLILYGAQALEIIGDHNLVFLATTSIAVGGGVACLMQLFKRMTPVIVAVTGSTIALLALIYIAIHPEIVTGTMTEFRALNYMVLVYLGAAGLSYSSGENIIIQYGPLMFTELLLSVGYFIEMFLIGLFHYIYVFRPNVLLTTSGFYTFQIVAIAFLCLNAILILALYGLVGFEQIPYKSLITIQQFIMGIKLRASESNPVMDIEHTHIWTGPMAHQPVFEMLDTKHEQQSVHL